MKKVVLLAFVLVLLSTTIIGRFTRPVEASGTITIKADGSVEGTTHIMSDDNVTYTFTDNIFNQSIVVERDNIVIDGAGYTVQGTGSGAGISLTGRSNVTIKNMEIKTFYYGISLYESFNNTLIGNAVSNNTHGINLIFYSINNTLVSNIVSNNSCGIYLWGSEAERVRCNNTLIGNTVLNNTYGIFLLFSDDNIIFHNNFINNTQQVDSYASTNIWDNGDEGNYWSDYEDRYPNATEIDGIWDTAYVIDENNQDNYPIVPEFPTWTSILLLFVILTVAIAIYKRRLLKTPIH